MKARGLRPFDDHDDELQRLLGAAGPRPPVPEPALQSLRATAHAEWERLPKHSSARASSPRRWMPLLLAAGLLVALAIGWRAGWDRRGESGPGAPVASVEFLRGDPSLGPTRASSMPALGSALSAGARIATPAGEPAGRIALRLAGGGSLRLDRDTSVRLVSATRIELERGAVYFDSRHSGARSEAIEIATALGPVRELGTQFEVRLDTGRPGEIAVRVREGSVALALRTGAQSVAAGERLVAGASGVTERGPSARHGAEWDWILDAAPVPDFEGRSLRAVLDWACRELGWELRFADPGLERDAEKIRLHGAVEGLRPDQAVDASLAGAGLGRRLEAGVLIVTRFAPRADG